MRLCRLSLSVFVFATMIATASAHAACTNASLTGVSGFLYVSRNGTTGARDNGAGQIAFDGKGGLTGTNTNVSDGTSGWQSSSNPFTGTYSVATNCAGTLSVVNPDGSSGGHYNFMLDNGNKGAQFIDTDAGFVRTGLLAEQGTVTCGLTGTSRTFAANLTGTLVGAGPVGYVGRVTLNGKGSVSGTLTVNVNGTITKVPVSGTYTENADCTGTAAVTPKGFSTMNFTFVVVSLGKELLMVETDNNTVVSGTMEQ